MKAMELESYQNSRTPYCTARRRFDETCCVPVRGYCRQGGIKKVQEISSGLVSRCDRVVNAAFERMRLDSLPQPPNIARVTLAGSVR